MIKILLTYSQALPHETRLIENLMREEWDFLHVNKPDYTREELINFLELIPQYHHKIVLHQHFDLIHEFELAGIHLSKNDRLDLSYADELTSACDLRSLCVVNGCLEVSGQKPDLVSYNAHDFKEMDHLPFRTDYILLSPIFDYPNNSDQPPLMSDPNLLRAYLQHSTHRIIAWGGVHNERIQQCQECGFDGYALSGEIWKKYFTFVETIQ
jgi:thiamine-phosphate pyrophosphorylase